MDTQNRTTATAGLEFKAKAFGKVQSFTVGPKCNGEKGQWVCTTCGVFLANNWEKDSHCDGRARGGGPHVLAWRCYEHGPEVP